MHIAHTLGYFMDDVVPLAGYIRCTLLEGVWFGSNEGVSSEVRGSTPLVGVCITYWEDWNWETMFTETKNHYVSIQPL